MNDLIWHDPTLETPEIPGNNKCITIIILVEDKRYIGLYVRHEYDNNYYLGSKFPYMKIGQDQIFQWAYLNEPE